MQKIPVFYSDAQVHDACSFSKSPLKPGLLSRRIGTDQSFQIISGLIGPVSLDRVAQTHDAEHARKLFAGEVEDGFGNKSKKGMLAIRNTVGNFLAAAEWAAAGKVDGNPDTDVIHPGVVWSLTSGFHHAHHDHCSGFCSIESLTLAAFELQKLRGMKTLIVDEDAHWGDGCVSMIDRNKMQQYCEYMYSPHTHQGADLEKFERHLSIMLRVFRPDIIFYQAGADNWICDPLGGKLTMEQMFRRDVMMMQIAKDFKVPLVVNLAGGYAEQYEDTLQIHLNTGEAMKQVFLGIEGKPLYPTHAVELEAA